MSRLLSIKLLVVLFTSMSVNATHAQDPDGQSPTRGFQPNGAYALSDIESISLAGGNMLYSLPLASLPASRGGRLKPTVHLRYNSKLFNTQMRMCLGPSCTFKYVQTDLIPSTFGGWTYGTHYFVLTTNRATNYVDGAPSPWNQYKFKTEIYFPDGSSHQLRPSNQTPTNEYYAVSPASPGTTRTYYTTDGSYLRVEFSTDGASWTIYFPDASTVNFNNSTGVQTTTDGNGNFYTTQNVSLPNGNPATVITDQLNRKITIEKPVSGPHYVRMNGVGGTELVTTINWGTTNPQGKKWLWKEFVEEGISQYKTSVSVRPIITNINLPNGLSYQFEYNSNVFDPLNPTKSVGWGELYRTTLPTGAVVQYAYSMNNRHGNETDDIIEPKHIMWDHPTSKQLSYTDSYDGVNTPRTDTWTYAVNIIEGGPAEGQTSSATASSPDGGVNTEHFFANLTGQTNFGKAGLTYKSIGPDGSRVERHWQENTPYNASGSTKNFYVKTEFVSIPDTAGTLVKTAIKDYVYDKNGNVTQIAEYDWVPYGDVARDAEGKPTGVIPASAQLKKVTASGFYNQTPAADSSAYHAALYNLSTAPNLRNAAKWSEVRSGFAASSALSRVEFDYDDPNTKGNLTTTRTWDSNKGARTDPLTASNSISTSAQYNSYGSPTLTVDARQTQTQIIYDAVGGFTDLYPTKVKTAYQTAIQRTQTREYDLNTGVVTKVTDFDNNVSTSTVYDVFGRPTLVKAAEGKLEETRTTTEYSDTLRRVIVKSDLNVVGDAKLVSIRHYDQLGRLRLSRQLEDSATESATDETTGIKVQTRYLYSGSNSFQLVSNAFRAATSGAAGSEQTMGWTRSKMDVAGRVLEVQTFGGATLPSPWGANSSSSGTVSTTYNTNFTTVADQAGKLRRTMTDGVGKLVRIDEPDAGGNLGSTAAPVQPTSYAYNVLDNLTMVTQGSQTRTFTYDSLSRLRSAVNPESGTINYQYDDNNNLVVKKDARGVSVHFAYDALNRPARRWYNASDDVSATTHNVPALPSAVGATDEVKFYYDNQALPAGAPSYTRGSAVGRLVAQTYGAGSNGDYYAYDVLGRPTLKFQQIGTVNYKLEAAYKLSGAVSSLIYPSNNTITNTFDQAGRLTNFSGNLGGETRTYASGNVYTPSGALLKEQFGTNTAVYHKLHYNSRQQLCDVRASNVNDEWGGELGALVNYYGTPYAHCGSGTDNNGNLLMSQTIINSVYFEDRYTYDSLNRLTAVSEYQNGTNLIGTQEYDYDRWGNRTIKATSTLGTYKQFTVNTMNNRLGVPGGQSGVMEYDQAGNLTNDTYTGVGNRTYDAENKITSAMGGFNPQAQLYKYDGSGQRIKRTVEGVETWQVYGFGGELLAEYAANGAVANPQKEYGYRNGQLLVQAKPETVWSDDAVPAGAAIAGEGESWNWVSSSPSPFSASTAHQSNIVAGLHQHYFYGATATLSVTAGDKLFAYVYLDPGNMPSQIMLQWAEGSSWEHRAYWGANNLPWGVDGTNSRRYMGPLPAAGSWVRLEVPASLVGLEGYTLHGMAFSMWGGRATWDRAGKASSVQWLVVDHLGTPRMIIDQTGTLANIKRHDYLPFGEELFAPVGGRGPGLGYAISDGVRQQFTSKERDIETGLDYFEARYYGSTAARFISPDPYNIILEAQATAEINPDKARVQFISYLNHPQQWNRYVYVVNNPLRYIDPTGEQLWLTGSEEEQKAALERIKELVGEEGAKLLTTRVMDTHVGRVMVVEYTGKDRDALAATSEIGVEIADLIDSNRVVEYRIASSFSYKGRSNVQTGGARCGGACTVGAEESLTGNTQIFVNSKSADFAQEVLGGSVRGGLLSNNGRPLDFYDDIVDAHEFGHAYANIIDGVSVNSEQSDRRARQFENVVRKRRGLSNRRVRER